MESSESRRQSDVLPSIYDYDRAQREGPQFQQRHPSIARTSISQASPISPTTMFGSNGPVHSYPPPLSSGIHTPPESRRTSDGTPGRQSLPSLHEALSDKPGFSAPSPMHTPPIGSGSFAAPPRTNSVSIPVPRSQPMDSHSAPPPPVPHGYGSSAHHQPPPPPGPIHHESPYSRHDSLSNGRTLPPNPYSSAQPPPPIPAMHPQEAYPPPPPPPQAPHHASTPYQTHSQYPSSSQTPSPHYTQPSAFSNGSVPPPPAQYPPYQPQQPQQQPQQQHHHHHQPPPPPQAQHQPPYQSHQPQQSPYQYPPRQENGYPPSEPPGLPIPSPGPKTGMKRGNGYGSAIERALSISAIRRDMESIKEHSAKIYHIVDRYQSLSDGGQQPYPGGLHASLQEFAEALQRSVRNTDALTNCHHVFQSLSDRELAEQSANKMTGISHGSEYGTDDGQSYADETRSNGSQQPEKKMRRGRAAPPGRCHSCHRAETPEWRRGPDGARTLCNACGLHYAKLTRKLSKNPNAASALTGRKPNSATLP